MQAGMVTVGAGGTVTVTFPTAFSFAPIVVGTGYTGVGTPQLAVISSITATQVNFHLYDAAAAATSGYINWFAVGPE
jgi:hypothetical protein